MQKYHGYNIIPIGDHCAVPILLKELNLRCKSYPFDWVTKTEQLHDTNILYNIQLIDALCSTDDIDSIVDMYIGDAFNSSNKTNTVNTIWFPHDTENVKEIFEKYKRRFIRLKQDLSNKNIFILLTRHYYIDQDKFQEIKEKLLKYNSESIIVFISGTDHSYFEDMKYINVIFKFINYDITKFYNYDYTTFRPSIKRFLIELLL
jgi:hypothetical protein